MQIQPQQYDLVSCNMTCDEFIQHIEAVNVAINQSNFNIFVLGILLIILGGLIGYCICDLIKKKNEVK